MRIVHLIDTMEVGGMERLVVLLCRWQRDQGHTPSVQCLYRVGTLGEQLRRDGFEVNCCDQEAGRRSGRVYRALVRQRPDVVHCHNATAAILGAMAARRAGAGSVIATRHGVVDPPYALRRELKFSLASRWCDWIVAVCERARDNLQGAPFATRRKVVRVYNGVSVSPERSSWQPTKGGFTFLHVGRLCAVKDQENLLLAFALAAMHIPNLKLWIVGDGPLRSQLENTSRELGLTQSVEFFGERQDVSSFLAAADAFALSSSTEGLPVSLLEAMAAGLPAVVTEVGGIKELIRLTDAIVGVPPNNPLALAVAMEKICRRTDDLPRLRALAEQCYAKHFTIERMAAQYMSLYTSKHSDAEGRHDDIFPEEPPSEACLAQKAG